MRLILGSTSPRRKDLLSVLGLTFDVVAPRTKEQRRPHEGPSTYVKRNALEKAKDVIGQLTSEAGEGIVIAGDTIVVLGEDVLEKPHDKAEAKDMLQRLSGTEHVVISGVCLHGVGKVAHKVATFEEKTRVKIKTLSAQEIDWYISTGEPMDKAGSYGAQGVGSYMVASINGSYTNVVGLPTAPVVNQLVELF